MTRTKKTTRIVVNAALFWDALEDQGISQNALARRLGISAGYMSELVSGKKSPSAILAQRLQRALGITSRQRLFVERGHGITPTANKH